jgi:hypothetical protein
MDVPYVMFSCALSHKHISLWFDLVVVGRGGDKSSVKDALVGGGKKPDRLEPVQEDDQLDITFLDNFMIMLCYILYTVILFYKGLCTS